VHLLIVTEASSLGGLEVHTIQLANALSERGHSIDMVELDQAVFSRSSIPLAQSIRHVHHPARRGRRSPSFLDWRASLSGFHADAVIWPRRSVFHRPQLDLAIRVSFPGRSLEIVHATVPVTSAREIRARMFNRAMGLYVGTLARRPIVCVSDAERCRLVGNFGIREADVITIHNGVDTQRFQPDASRRRDVRARWSVPEGATVFGMVGRLSHEKRPVEALDAFAKIRSRLPGHDLRLVYVGEGQLAGALARELDARALRGAVELAGFIADTAGVYNALDFLLLPSEREALPLTLLEAMSSASIPIAMRVGGIPEVLSDPRVGRLVQQDDFADLEESIAWAATLSTSERADMALHARRRVSEHFNAETQLARLASHIESVFGSSRT
jgi:glycosyltransferase involved in cell wall biosynthesis